MSNRPEWPAYILSALALIAMTVLSAIDKTIPTVMPYIAVGALTGGAGITLGTGSPPVQNPPQDFAKNAVVTPPPTVT